MFDFSLLRRLATASSPAGNENAVREIIVSRLTELGLPASLSPDGSVASVIRSSDPSAQSLMLQAHTDEVGFMVKSHTEDGYLKLAPLGIRDSRLLTGRRVTVMGKNGLLSGFIGAVPIHLSKNNKKIPQYSDLYADIGTETKEEAEELAPIGSFGCFTSNFETFGADNGYIKSKALSGRAACAVLLEIAKHFSSQNTSLPFNLYFAFSPRGKVTLSGGSALYSRLKPDALVSVCAFEIPYDASCFSVSGAAVPMMEEKYPLDASLASQLRLAFTEKKILSDIPPTSEGEECEFDIIRLKAAGARVAAIKLPVKNRNTASELMRCDVISSVTDALVSILPRLKI